MTTLADASIEELKAEIARKKEEAETRKINARIAEWERLRQILSTDAINVLAPEHGKAGWCTDENARQDVCARCVLVNLKEGESSPAYTAKTLGLTFTFEIHGLLGDVM